MFFSDQMRIGILIFQVELIINILKFNSTKISFKSIFRMKAVFVLSFIASLLAVGQVKYSLLMFMNII